MGLSTHTQNQINIHLSSKECTEGRAQHDIHEQIPTQLSVSAQIISRITNGQLVCQKQTLSGSDVHAHTYASE